MVVNTSLAHVSDTLFTTAIATYSLAMIGYAGEYAFGRRGRVAESAPQRELVGAGAGGSAPSGLPPADQAPVTTSRGAAGERFGRAAVVVTIIGVLIHLSSIAIRGVAVDEVPWSNMYEFASVVGVIAVIAFLVGMARMPQIRYLGLFVMFPVVLIMFLAGTVLYSQGLAARARPAVLLAGHSRHRRRRRPRAS